MEPGPQSRPGFSQLAAAWGVHAFTAMGTVLALLALMAAVEARWAEALLWLIAALVIDGVDGSLARWAKVKERAPRIDGATMDLVVDYLNYVFVPAVLIWRAGLVPEGAAPILAGLILVSALYNFTRSDMKTDDNYFRGFPALWNLVAFYLFLARPGETVGALAVVAFAALTFAPVHFVHPFRVTDYGRFAPLTAAVWAVSTAALLYPGWSDFARGLCMGVSLGTGIVLLAMGFLRTLRGPRPKRPEPLSS
jgi:phosphatidylcholine synthase